MRSASVLIRPVVPDLASPFSRTCGSPVAIFLSSPIDSQIGAHVGVSEYHIQHSKVVGLCAMETRRGRELSRASKSIQPQATATEKSPVVRNLSNPNMHFMS